MCISILYSALLLFSFFCSTACSDWDKREGTLNLVLEFGETDLAAFLRSRGPNNPLKDDPALLLYLWKQMLSIVKV